MVRTEPQATSCARCISSSDRTAYVTCRSELVVFSLPYTPPRVHDVVNACHLMNSHSVVCNTGIPVSGKPCAMQSRRGKHFVVMFRYCVYIDIEHFGASRVLPSWGGKWQRKNRSSPSSMKRATTTRQCPSGEDCSKAKCCSSSASQYFLKNDDWTVHSDGCAPGVHNFDDDKPWSCNCSVRILATRTRSRSSRGFAV